MNVRDRSAKPIIMMLTCMLSRGELSTGMTCVICGSIWLMWLTSRKKPDMRKPHVSMMGKRKLSRRLSSMTVHATKSIVS